MWARDRATNGLGMRLDEVSPGRAQLSMTITETMTSGHRICHGGFIVSLTDSAIAFAVHPRGEAAVAQHAQISFIRPAHLGETLITNCEGRMYPGRSGMYDVIVTTAAGELVADFRGDTRTIAAKAET